MSLAEVIVLAVEVAYNDFSLLFKAGDDALKRVLLMGFYVGVGIPVLASNDRTTDRGYVGKVCSRHRRGNCQTMIWTHRYM